jgi:hypothetical protein
LTITQAHERLPVMAPGVALSGVGVNLVRNRRFDRDRNDVVVNAIAGSRGSREDGREALMRIADDVRLGFYRPQRHASQFA